MLHAVHSAVCCRGGVEGLGRYEGSEDSKELGTRVWVVGLRVWGWGFRVQDLRLKTQG